MRPSNCFACWLPASFSNIASDPSGLTFVGHECSTLERSLTATFQEFDYDLPDSCLCLVHGPAGFNDSEALRFSRCQFQVCFAHSSVKGGVFRIQPIAALFVARSSSGALQAIGYGEVKEHREVRLQSLGCELDSFRNQLRRQPA